MTEIVDWLQTPHGQHAIELAQSVKKAASDPLAVASALERELGLPSTYRAAATLQADLRDRLLARWSEVPEMLFTRDGIEQATHPIVRRWRSLRLAKLGVSSIADLGCGLGFESRTFADHGMTVRAVERDVETAAIATLNLAKHPARVDVFDVVEDKGALDALLSEVDAVFVDPARRDTNAPRSIDGATGNRVSDPEDWSPRWSWVRNLADTQPKLVAKVAPGIDHDLLPPDSQTVWFSIKNVLVEASVWFSGFALSPERVAIAVDRHGDFAELDSQSPTSAAVGEVSTFLLDPAPSITRAGLVQQLAALTDSHRIDEHLGYLSCEKEPEDSPLFVTYEVLQSLKFDEKAIASALNEIGARDVQVSGRGHRIDTETLTKKLKKNLSGDKVISVLLARIGNDVTAILAQRLN
ncbi:MAG: hypothetical protein RIS43_837 [Actinomycetota bacterium]